jgi:hypothetical protein
MQTISGSLSEGWCFVRFAVSRTSIWRDLIFPEFKQDFIGTGQLLLPMFWDGPPQIWHWSYVWLAKTFSNKQVFGSVWLETTILDCKHPEGYGFVNISPLLVASVASISVVYFRQKVSISLDTVIRPKNCLKETPQSKCFWPFILFLFSERGINLN